MDKTPIEIKLMQDIKFVIDLNEVKTKEIQKKNKIIKTQNEVITEYKKRFAEYENKIAELVENNKQLSNQITKTNKHLEDIYPLHIF
jgi:septal ring factor EnvC (AmiA/AmiB activator)